MGGDLVMLALVAMAQLADTVVVTPAGLPGAVEVTAMEEVRVGTLDGPEAEAFGFVVGIGTLPDQTLFVADGQQQVVRVFDPSGTHVRDIGRQGQGPGEFVGIWGIATTPNDELLVWDGSGYRVTHFDRSGQILNSFRPEMTALVGGPTRGVVVESNGDVLLRTAGARFRPTEGAQELVYGWLRFQADGQFVDSLIPTRRQVDGFVSGFRIETVSTPSPLGYFVSGRTDEYAVFLPTADGQTLRIQGEPERVELHPEEAEQWERYGEVFDERMGWDSPPVPKFKPAFRTLAVDAEGRIWVQRYVAAIRAPEHARALMEGPSVEWVEPSVWDVLSPSGSYLGSVTLPLRADFGEARGDKAWFILRGEFDEQYVVRYRLEGLGADE